MATWRFVCVLVFVIICNVIMIKGKGAGAFVKPPLLYSIREIGKVRSGKINSISTQSTPKKHTILSRPKVALTREESKNHYLHDLILKHKLKCDVILLPVLEHSSRLEDSTCYVQLLEALATTDVVVISSPQAAMDFVKIWPNIEKKDLKFAAIGKKTSSILYQSGIHTDFSPLCETAFALGCELPRSLGTKILYPASAIAQNAIVEKLEMRGFQVKRINIYDTYGARWNEDLMKKAGEINIVTLTSPSAARAWAARAGCDFDAVVIGSTTQKMAESLDFASVTCVNEKLNSLKGLVEGIKQVLQDKYNT